MPLPTTWNAMPDVGAARGQGPGVDACPDPQIGRLLWRGQPEHRQVRARPVREVRRDHLREFPEAVATASLPRQTNDRRARQRPVPPCRTASAIASQISQDSHLALPATVQPPTGTHRTCLEIGSPHDHAQSILRNLARSPRSRRAMLRPLADLEFSAA